MTSDFDVCIIGADPIGSTITNLLLKNNLKVAIVEKKNEIGYPLQCAGILSTHIKEVNDLPENLILNKVKDQNHTLHLEKEENAAYVIDRIEYDKYLFKKALNNNSLFINQKAIDFNIDNAIVKLQNGEKIKSKIIVACDGYNSKLAQKFKNTQENFKAFKILVKIDSNNLNKDHVDIYLNKEILPEFLWMIPIKRISKRI